MSELTFPLNMSLNIQYENRWNVKLQMLSKCCIVEHQLNHFNVHAIAVYVLV